MLYWINFKIYNPFWSHQPVSHLHHFYRTWFNPHVIYPHFYVPKFMNTLNIKTISWSTFKNKENFTSHIRDHYWREKNAHYTPMLEKHMKPYYDNDNNAYISLYYLHDILVGTITNRTLRIHINNQRFAVSYIDYLCVHKGYRKKRVAPELIQTHEHHQRTKSTNKCVVSLFKKEGNLHAFTPLVKYSTYTYDLRSKTSILLNYTQSSSFYHYEVVEGSLSLLKTILEYVESIQHLFSCFILPPLEILKQLIERKSILLYCLVNKNALQNTQKIQALYFFRPTGVYINSSKENIECFASLFNSHVCSQLDFLLGFLSSVKKMKDIYGHLQVESLGHNTILNGFLTESTKKLYKYKTQCAYYLYNYSHREIDSTKVCILL